MPPSIDRDVGYSVMTDKAASPVFRGRVTERKLVAASRALLALCRCEDIDAVLEANWRKVVDGYYIDSGGHQMPTVDEPPFNSDPLLKLANLFAVLATPDNTDGPA